MNSVIFRQIFNLNFELFRRKISVQISVGVVRFSLDVILRLTRCCTRISHLAHVQLQVHLTSNQAADISTSNVPPVLLSNRSATGGNGRNRIARLTVLGLTNSRGKQDQNGSDHQPLPSKVLADVDGAGCEAPRRGTIGSLRRTRR